MKPENVIFQACIRETSLRRAAFFGPLLHEYVGCMIEVCRVFHVNFSQSRVSNFQKFLGSMPPDPPRRPRTHGKNLKYVHER